MGLRGCDVRFSDGDHFRLLVRRWEIVDAGAGSPGARRRVLSDQATKQATRTRTTALGSELVQFGCRWIDYRRHLEHAIRGKSAKPGVLTDDVGVWRDVYTGDLVLGHEALDPLNAGTELLQYGAGFL